MARTRTAEENSLWWQRQADRYDRQAATHLAAGSLANWTRYTDKAIAARAHAETYLKPC